MADLCRLMSFGIPDVALHLVLAHLDNPADRAAVSLVCRSWHRADACTRRHVTVALSYSASPEHLARCFPGLLSLKLKSKPRAAMFGLIPSGWGGAATPWLLSIQSFPALRSLHLRRMVVTDADLSLLAASPGAPLLLALHLDCCDGFSTHALARIATSCPRLRTLFLEESAIVDHSPDWLRLLATHAPTLQALNFYNTDLTFCPPDLVLLARNCPALSTLKVSERDLSDLVPIFHVAAALQDFAGGSFNAYPDGYGAKFYFPPSLHSLSLSFLAADNMHILFPYAAALKKLDLQYALLTTDDHCQLIPRCPNLLVLAVREVVGDRGLEVVAQTCRKLRRLRVERGYDDQGGLEDQQSRVSQVGLTHIARGCPHLEHLAVYMSDITNGALEAVGTYCKNLVDFRLALLDRQESITELPLDNGVRALLHGCSRLGRFALYLRPGGLSDVGLGYIGEYGRNIPYMLLGNVGETDRGLMLFAGAHPNLQKLELRSCYFSERALALAVMQLPLLRYIWVHGYKATTDGSDLAAMARPYWNIEFISPGLEANADAQTQFLAYYSLAGRRTDCPSYIRYIQGEDTKSLEKTTSADLHHEWATQSSQVPTDGSSFLYGRQNDKEKIIEIVNQSAEEDNCTVIFVIAAPGVGKTTLARLVYNDQTISDSFDATIFVTLSESFDAKQIMKVIIEGITQTSCDMAEQDLLETVIREEFGGKKILLVLDDAQDAHKNGLSAILGHLNVASKGSVVLVNTNSKSAIAEYDLGVKALHYYYLNPLPETCCWEIFRRTAFQGRDPFALAGSVWICKKLVSMCGQNLLCLKFISGLMRNLDHEQWSEVLECDSWGMNKFGGDTLPALRVCYDYLPPHLKKCFSYFSLFPKNYIFKKDEVIYLWLSQGCIEHKKGRELENIGGEYFDELLGRFFIEESPDDSEGRFVMHAKICDLAKHVSVNEYFSSEDPMQRIPENTRHFSFLPCEYQTIQMKHMIEEARDLQSFSVLSRSSWDPISPVVNLADLSDLFKFRNLKTLNLNNTAIEELPNSIGSLENLLYLGLSNTRIRSLPSEISCLTNLQTLEAANCYYLHELPGTIKELVNLRHLDITKEWDYVRIPVGIGSLSNLRSLPSFNVGSDILQSTIGELKGLELLRGSLQIFGLENIPNETDAKEANLAGKLYLENVSLQWSPSIEYITEDHCEDIFEMVLENLQPCYSIRELVIRNYMGSKFPMWMGDVFYSQLESVILDNCPSCEMFPSLGGLPRLKYLSVQKIYGVREMRALGKFPSLQLLNLWEMHELELFEVNMGDFPCIQTLSINRCHKLKSIPCYPSLVDLSLHFCSRVPDIPELPSLEFLKIEGFKKIEVLDLPANLPMLKNVQIVDCSELLSLKGIPQLASIEKLEIIKCPKLDLNIIWGREVSKRESRTRICVNLVCQASTGHASFQPSSSTTAQVSEGPHH